MLRFDVSIDATIEAINYVREQLSDLSEFYMNYMYPKMLRDIDKLFEEQGRPRWQALKENYERWKRRYYPGLPILQLSGELRDSYSISSHPSHVLEIHPRSISLSSDVPYASLHETGTDDMAARPVIGSLFLDQGLRNQYQKLFKRHIQRTMKAAKHAGTVSVATKIGSTRGMGKQRRRGQKKVFGGGRFGRR